MSGSEVLHSAMNEQGGFVSMSPSADSLGGHAAAIKNTDGKQRRVRMTDRTSIVLSQGITSLTNALFGFEIARRSSSKELGALGIAIALSMVVIGACRACCTELLLQRPVDGDEPMARRVAWQIGVVGVVPLGAAAWALGPDVRVGVILIALALPFMVMEDFERFVAFRENAWRAVVGDASWLISTAVLFALLYRSGNRSTTAVVVAYVVGGVAGWLAMSLGKRRSVMHVGNRGWWAAHPVRARTFGTEFVLSSLLSGLSLPLLGVTAGLAAAGDVRAYLTILGPAIFIVQACGLLSARRIGALGVRACVRDRKLWVLSLLCTLSVASVGLALRTVPTERGTSLLGESWKSLAANAHYILASSVLALFAIAPLQVSRLYWPRRALIARAVSASSLLLVIVTKPVKQPLTNYLLGSAVAQGIIAVFTIYTYLDIGNSAAARSDDFAKR
jgi:hypothetical protein